MYTLLFLGSVLACWFVGRGPKTGVLSRTVFWVWGGFLGLGEVRDLYRKVGDIGGLHFPQVPSKSVPRGAKTSQKTVYLRIPSEQTTCCFLQARTEPSSASVTGSLDSGSLLLDTVKLW